LTGGGQAARAVAGALRWRQQRGVGADQATVFPQRDQALVLHVLHQLGVQTPQGGDMQLGARQGPCPVAELTQNAQICVHVGEEAVNLTLHAATAKPAQASDQLGQGQLARTREGAGMLWVASQGGKSRAMKVFCQIRQNALDGVRTWAQHANPHQGDRPANLQLSPPVGLSSVDCYAVPPSGVVVDLLQQRAWTRAEKRVETEAYVSVHLIRKKARSGRSLRSVGKELGVSYETVRKKLLNAKKNGSAKVQ
jgi:hypothetical protein